MKNAKKRKKTLKNGFYINGINQSDVIAEVL